MKLCNKKIGLVTVYVWYCVCVFFLTPLIIDYLFDSNNMMAELFAELFSVGLPVMYFAKKENKGELIFKIYSTSIKAIDSKKKCICIGIILFYVVAIQYLINFIKLIYIARTNDYSCVSVLSSMSFVVFIGAMVVFCVLPAVYEEFLFRGMYADAFEENKTGILYVTSALVFASEHANLISIINAFFVGIILMFLYRKLHSISIVIVLHFINNLCTVVFSSYFSFPYSALNLLTDYANKEQMYCAAIISMGTVIICLTMIILCMHSISADFMMDNKINLKTKEKKIEIKIVDNITIGILCALAIGMIILKVL